MAMVLHPSLENENALAQLAGFFERLALEAEREGVDANRIESRLRVAGAGSAVVDQIMAKLLDKIVAPLTSRGVCQNMIARRLVDRGFDRGDVVAAFGRLVGVRG